MNKIIKSFTSIFLVFVMVISLGVVVDAAGSTSVVVSNSSISVGDTTTVSVKASTSTDVKVKYTASMLEFDSCDAAGSSAESNTVTFNGTEANITFKAISGGTASIIVSGDSVSGSSTTISIEGSGTATVGAAVEPEESTSEEGSEETTEQSEPETTSNITYVSSGYLNDAGNFDIDGVEYVVSERYSESEIPAGFTNVTLNIAGHTYKELTNGSFTIVYLKPADNTAGSGTFYLYDEENSLVSPFEYVTAGGHFLLLGTAGYTVYSDMIQTETVIGGKPCIAYTNEGSTFYYLFGTDERGILDWYYYDPQYDEIGRIDETVLDMISVTTDQEAKVESVYDPNENYVLKLAKYRKIIAGLVILCIIFAFAFAKVKFIDSIDGGDEDEDVIFPDNNKKKKVRTERVVNKRPAPKKRVRPVDDDDDDDDDDEDDEPKSNGKSTQSSRVSDNSGIMDLNDL